MINSAQSPPAHQRNLSTLIQNQTDRGARKAPTLLMKADFAQPVSGGSQPLWYQGAGTQGPAGRAVRREMSTVREGRLRSQVAAITGGRPRRLNGAAGQTPPSIIYCSLCVYVVLVLSLVRRPSFVTSCMFTLMCCRRLSIIYCSL